MGTRSRDQLGTLDAAWEEPTRALPGAPRGSAPDKQLARHGTHRIEEETTSMPVEELDALLESAGSGVEGTTAALSAGEIDQLLDSSRPGAGFSKGAPRAGAAAARPGYAAAAPAGPPGGGIDIGEDEMGAAFDALEGTATPEPETLWRGPQEPPLPSFADPDADDGGVWPGEENDENEETDEPATRRIDADGEPGAADLEAWMAAPGGPAYAAPQAAPVWRTPAGPAPLPPEPPEPPASGAGWHEVPSERPAHAAYGSGAPPPPPLQPPPVAPLPSAGPPPAGAAPWNAPEPPAAEDAGSGLLRPSLIAAMAVGAIGMLGLTAFLVLRSPAQAPPAGTVATAAPAASPGAAVPAGAPGVRGEAEARAAVQRLADGVRHCAGNVIDRLPGTSPAVPANIRLMKNGVYASLPGEYRSPVFACTRYFENTPQAFQIQWQIFKGGTEGMAIAWLDTDDDGKADRAIGARARLVGPKQVELDPLEFLDPVPAVAPR